MLLAREKLTGDNKYFCENCQSKQDAERFIQLAKLPNTLCVQVRLSCTQFLQTLSRAAACRCCLPAVAACRCCLPAVATCRCCLPCLPACLACLPCLPALPALPTGQPSQLGSPPNDARFRAGYCRPPSRLAEQTESSVAADGGPSRPPCLPLPALPTYVPAIG